ncbi:MAG: caspase family protein [Cyanobacteria bacterium P01_D01_bin.71]
MGRNYAITIGINGYRNLQRLNYAKQDAEAVRQLFLQDLGFEGAYLFTDDSPDIPQDYGPDLESRPTYTTLRRFFRTRFDDIKKPWLRDGDNLWFFFAGHGVRANNRDYLMPMDGDRGDLSNSAIPIHYISERLRRSGADNVILLIDACRSFEGQRDGYGIGTEKQQGVITLFSCSPEESSYEIEELRQGAFTHVLLESLRHQGEGNCATVERLYQQLRYTVPQITRQYKRIAQTPYGVIEPPTKNHLILLPQNATLADIVTLKNDALRAEVQKDFKQAKQYWVRVLAASPADPEAIEGIERLSRMGITGTLPPVPPPQTDSPSQTTSRSAASSPGSPLPRPVAPPPQPVAQHPCPPSRPRSSSTPQLPVSRRRAIQILGLSGGGLGAVLLGRSLLQSVSNSGSDVSAPNDGAAPVDVDDAPGAPNDGAASQLTSADFSPVEIEVVTVQDDGNPATLETKQVQVFQEAIADIALGRVIN